MKAHAHVSRSMLSFVPVLLVGGVMATAAARGDEHDRAGVAAGSPSGEPAPFAFERSTPEEQGLDSAALLEALARIREDPIDIHSVIVIRHDHVILECYVHPYGPDTLHNLKSVSKSVISALSGIALGEGILDSLDQTVDEFFPQYITDDMDPRKRRIAIRHLLSMTAGLDLDENGPIMREVFAADDWIEAALARPMADDPGRRFLYSTPLTHTVSGILTEASGTSLLELARQHLFGPLGIERAQWTKGPRGYFFGGSELFLTPRGMAKFGVLFLHGGRWRGEPIVPEAWVRESTRNQQNAEAECQPYGFGWWPGREGGYSALGWGGQRITIDPGNDLVVVVTAADPNAYAKLFGGIEGDEPRDGPLPPNPEAVAALEELVDELAHPMPTPVPELPELTTRVSGRTYALDANPRGFRDITFDFPGGDVARITVGTPLGNLSFDIGLDGVDRVSSLGALGHMPEGNHVASRGAWTGENVFTIDSHELGNPSHTRMLVTFGDDGIEIRSATKPQDHHLVVEGRIAPPPADPP